MTAVVNPSYPADPDKAANAPYAACKALAWIFLCEYEKSRRREFPQMGRHAVPQLHRAGLPSDDGVGRGKRQPRTIVHAWHPSTNVVLTRTEACVPGAGNKDRTAWPDRYRFVGWAPSRRTGRALVHLFCVAVSYCTGASGRTNSMTVTSGGASRRMGGPQVPDPRLV